MTDWLRILKIKWHLWKAMRNFKRISEKENKTLSEFKIDEKTWIDQLKGETITVTATLCRDCHNCQELNECLELEKILIENNEYPFNFWTDKEKEKRIKMIGLIKNESVEGIL